MESQPQSPEFRNNPENFTHALYRDKKRKIMEKDGPVHNILVIIAYTQRPSLRTHADVSSRV